jgi:hypothetical protein
MVVLSKSLIWTFSHWIKLAARVCFADRDLEGELLDSFGNVSFVWIYLWLNG